MRIRNCAILIAVALLATGRGVAAGDVALVGGKIYVSPTGPAIEDGVVVVRNGRIAAVGPRAQVVVPPSAEVVDCRGGVVTAGFWNCHVHFMGPAVLQAGTRDGAALSLALEEMLTRWGFTTVFDLASSFENTAELRRRIDGGEIPGPRILTTGEPFYPKDGTPIYVRGFYAAHRLPSAEVATADEARARVRRQVGAGVDGVKLFAGSFVEGWKILPMPDDVARAIADEAHAAGRPVFAHPSNPVGIDVALRSGVDVLAHTTSVGGPWPPELVARLTAARVALVPTLSLFGIELKKSGASPADTERVLETVVAQLRAFAAGGGQVLFGTDVGYTQQHDTTEEFTLMARAGLDFQAILAALTTAPAERFQRAGELGRIAPGYLADLVVLEADPAEDITAFARVRRTVREGRVVYSRAGHR
ncbi:MAG TPA: amidohydrolase family protein [Opitutaceae bacterium]|nr:amidohydrolase family protein [Opitutaceae bacterium]